MRNHSERVSVLGHAFGSGEGSVTYACGMGWSWPSASVRQATGLAHFLHEIWWSLQACVLAMPLAIHSARMPAMAWRTASTGQSGW